MLKQQKEEEPIIREQFLRKKDEKWRSGAVGGDVFMTKKRLTRWGDAAHGCRTYAYQSLDKRLFFLVHEKKIL